jgi:hypothetical protein
VETPSAWAMSLMPIARSEVAVLRGFVGFIYLLRLA